MGPWLREVAELVDVARRRPPAGGSGASSKQGHSGSGRTVASPKTPSSRQRGGAKEARAGSRLTITSSEDLRGLLDGRRAASGDVHQLSHLPEPGVHGRSFFHLDGRTPKEGLRGM